MAINEAYLGFIQGIIARMANNAFLIKGWSLTITIALITFLGTLILGRSIDSTELLYLIALGCLVVAIFWWLDNYFFYQEKRYRALYNHVINPSNSATGGTYNLSVDDVLGAAPKWERIKTLTTNAVYPLYLLQLILYLFVFLFAYFS